MEFGNSKIPGSRSETRQDVGIAESTQIQHSYIGPCLGDYSGFYSSFKASISATTDIYLPVISCHHTCKTCWHASNLENVTKGKDEI